ncbi:hypothetical protein E1B28_005929 [Marasmius oreades]|uniref:Uncharacterized protein n=1 Tax=Marasmius oreades TaxID=181124 RepID=A0A9P7UVC0_9AGAR|nr:uncharacterized protein E1B28_005929 [Marasmius oreades]KAG7095150.1 hypothetical protein E1B28_005929 [Marasmius oreades]
MTTDELCPATDEKLTEDIEATELNDEGGLDDSDVLMADLTAHVMKKPGRNHCYTERTLQAGLSSCAEAEGNLPELAEVLATDAQRKSRRERKPNRLYTGWWRHANDQDQDLSLNAENGMDSEIVGLASQTRTETKNQSQKGREGKKNAPKRF